MCLECWELFDFDTFFQMLKSKHGYDGVIASFIRRWNNQSTTIRFGQGDFDTNNATKDKWIRH
jgi:hypothetical protein